MNNPQLIEMAKEYKEASNHIIHNAENILSKKGLLDSSLPMIQISNTVNDETYHIIYFPDSKGMEISVERSGKDLPDLVRFPNGSYSMIVGFKDITKYSLLFEDGQVQFLLDGKTIHTIPDIG